MASLSRVAMSLSRIGANLHKSQQDSSKSPSISTQPQDPRATRKTPASRYEPARVVTSLPKEPARHQSLTASHRKPPASHCKSTQAPARNPRVTNQSPRVPYEPSQDCRKATARQPRADPNLPKEPARHQPVTASHHQSPRATWKADPDPRCDEDGLTK